MPEQSDDDPFWDSGDDPSEDRQTRLHRFCASLVLTCQLADVDTVRTAFHESVQSGQSLAELLLNRGVITVEDRQALDHLTRRHSDSNAASARRTNRQPQPDDESETDSEDTLTGDPTEGSIDLDLDLVLNPGGFQNYHLTREIARGGMGIVYEAVQKNLGRTVALKTIRAGEFANQHLVQRFRAEAEAAAKLHHPGIVPVFEVGEERGLHFFSMALVNGESLREIVQRDGPFDASQAVEIMAAVGDAVEYANDHGIVHRDLKPENLLRDQSGRVQITDFGVAKLMEADLSMTMTGQLLGTPSYMAPEQAQGDRVGVDHRTDVYGLGATLYYLLTGRPPFQAASKWETLQQVTETEPVAPRELNPSIPKDLETICLKCLRKDRGRRYHTAAAFAADLRRFQQREPILARPVGTFEKVRLWCGRHRAITTALMLTLLLGGTTAGIVLYQRAENQRDVALARKESDRREAISRVEGLANAPAAGVPFAIQTLEPFGDHAEVVLVSHFEDPDRSERERLHAAIGLAKFGDVRTEDIVELIPNADREECPNIIAALARSTDAPRQLRAAAARSVGDLEAQARFAIVAFHLGDPSLAAMMARTRPDPAPRTMLERVFAGWHDSEFKLPDQIAEVGDETLRAALLAGVWQSWTFPELRTEPNGFKPDQNLVEQWSETASRLYLSARDSRSHAISDLILRTLGESVPRTPPQSAPDVERDWCVTLSGLTMIRIPPGEFVRPMTLRPDSGSQQVIITDEILLSDREISAKLFQEFLLATGETRRAEMISGDGIALHGVPELDHPARNISWIDAVRFCNWLSEREGFQPVYRFVGAGEDVGWECDLKADGYRLPTTAEWHNAYTLEAESEFFWGNLPALAEVYATYRTEQMEARGNRLPNSGGLFNLASHVQEWCEDNYNQDYGPKKIIHNPWTWTTNGIMRAIQGGKFTNGIKGLKVKPTVGGDLRVGGTYTGFRVARSTTPRTITLISPIDRKVQ